MKDWTPLVEDGPTYSELLEEISVNNRTQMDFVAFHAARQPRRLVAMDMRPLGAWTYAELDDEIARCVAVLAGRGIGRGDRVAVLARNCVHLIVLHLACSRHGAIFVALNWRLAAAELTEIVADAAPSLLVFDDASESLAMTCAPDHSRLPMKDLRNAIATASPIDAARADDDVPSLLLYTSGTSGRSKGVMLSERNAFFTGVNFALATQVDRQSALLCDAPMFHVIALVIGLRAVLQQGAAILVSDGFEPVTTNMRIGDPSLAVTHYFCVPQMAAALRAAKNFDASRLARLTALVVGGAPMDQDSVLAWLDDGIMLANGFGMTEIGAGAAMPLDLSIIRARPMSAGVFPPTQQARVVAPDGREAPVGTPGEIWVKGPNVSGGYWNRPDETASAFTADGWFKTGDIGFIEAGGYLTLVDRKKDMYISGGENVYPAEVEKVLKMCPGVAEAAVFGTADPRWGEVGYACVVPEGEPELTSDKLRLFCTERLAGYKVPKYFVLVNELPRTGSGKVLKHVLRHQVAEGRTGLLA